MKVMKKLFALAPLKYCSLLPLCGERRCNKLKCFCDRSKNSKPFPAPSAVEMTVCSHLLCVINGAPHLHQSRLLLRNFHISGNPDREGEQVKYHPDRTQHSVAECGQLLRDVSESQLCPGLVLGTAYMQKCRPKP